MKKLTVMAGLLLAMALAWSPREAGAQCLRARVVVSAPYVSYAPAYVAPVKVYKAPVYYEPPYYYSVTDSYRDGIIAKAAAYDAAVLILSGKLSPAPPATAPLPRYREPPAADAPGRDAPRTTPPGTGAAGGAVPPALAKVIESRCVKCHAGPGKNGIDLSSAALPALTRAEWLECSLRVSVDGEAAMPKGGPACSPEEAGLFAAMALAARRK